MPQFATKILPNLDDSFKYTLYSHNGDYPFNEQFRSIVEDPKIEHIYAQNLDMDPGPKLTLLPIGIARDMFPHGNLDQLYETMSKTYYLKKELPIYININESTHPLRKEIMDVIRRSPKDWKNNVVTQPKEFKEYLLDLSRCRFCLCLRGNGLDTHRFWEALYLGVIPVLVMTPDIIKFVSHLRKQFIPHILINSVDFFNKQNTDYFSEELYNMTLKTKFGVNVSLQSMNSLSLGSYF
jgi:hypothetical protein